jgi:L-lactate dehydrogenase complex protein LldE
MSPNVQLFITCLLDTFYPAVGEAVVRVLQRAGARVEFPSGQTCCGQPAFNAGMRAQARPIAQQTIRAFENTGGVVVVPSGSCAAMLRHGYLELFANEPAWLRRAQALAERTYEFSEYLVDVLQVDDVGASYPGKLAYHASCHLRRDLGVDRQPRLLLSRVRRAEIVELPYATECCGFGGVFSVEHPELSSAMLARKIANLEISGAPTLVSCDGGCITHINGGLQHPGVDLNTRSARQAVHIATILDSR